MDLTKSQRDDPRATLARKECGGVYFGALSERCGVNDESIRLVALERESGLQIDRERVLRDINDAMDAIEAKTTSA